MIIHRVLLLKPDKNHIITYTISSEGHKQGKTGEITGREWLVMLKGWTFEMPINEQCVSEDVNISRQQVFDQSTNQSVTNATLRKNFNYIE